MQRDRLQEPGTQRLLCRLRNNPSHLSRFAGEVELENVSGELLQVMIQASEFEHLNLLISDSKGTLVSAFHYGELFSPFSLGHVWELLPGQKFVGSVSLMGNVPPERRLPGRYTIQAVYEFDSLYAASDPLDFELLAE
jgi:hypothetical protein